MSQIRIAGIVIDSITDGPGLRAAVFVQGCPHRCDGCHNPETHDFSGGDVTTTEEIFEKIRSNPLLSGVTFTGGEPMCQARALAELADMIKPTGLKIAVYTGYTWEELTAENDPDRIKLLKLADVVIDGPFEVSQRSLDLKFRGSVNQRVINVAQSLKRNKVVVKKSSGWA